MNKISYQNLQSTKLIGFYLANSENQNITKSQNSYGIYFENLNILNYLTLKSPKKVNQWI